MKKSCVLGATLVALTVGFGAGSTAFAKGHDQGVADGTPKDPSLLRGGAVAGVGEPGIGVDPKSGVFLGVAADLDADLTYGQFIVRDQAKDGGRGIVLDLDGRK